MPKLQYKGRKEDCKPDFLRGSLYISPSEVSPRPGSVRSLIFLYRIYLLNSACCNASQSLSPDGYRILEDSTFIWIQWIDQHDTVQFSQRVLWKFVPVYCKTRGLGVRLTLTIQSQSRSIPLIDWLLGLVTAMTKKLFLFEFSFSFKTFLVCFRREFSEFQPHKLNWQAEIYYWACA